MREFRIWHILVALLLCNGIQAQPLFTEKDIELSKELVQIAASKGGFLRVHPDLKHDESYAGAWLYLAQTASDPEAAAVSVSAVFSLYSPGAATARYNGRTLHRRHYGEGVKRIVYGRLFSRDCMTLERAITTSSLSVWGGHNPHEPTVVRLLELIQNHPEASIRRRATMAFWTYYTPDRRVARAYQSQILDSAHPYNVYTGLVQTRRMRQKKVDYGPDEDRLFFATAAKLVTHESPDIRGAATRLLPWVVSDKERSSLKPVLARMLKDEHPYVRAQALRAAADLGDWTMIPLMMKLVEDWEEADFVQQTSERSTNTLSGGYGETVNAAALNALHSLTSDNKEFGFRFALWKTNDLDRGKLKKEVQRAKVWFQKSQMRF